MPTLPAAISRKAVTPGLFLLSMLGVMALTQHSGTVSGRQNQLKTIGDLLRQSSTVMRAMKSPAGVKDRALFNSECESFCTCTTLRKYFRRWAVRNGLEVKQCALETTH
jgi:hypothetical protein